MHVWAVGSGMGRLKSLTVTRECVRVLASAGGNGRHAGTATLAPCSARARARPGVRARAVQRAAPPHSPGERQRQRRERRQCRPGGPAEGTVQGCAWGGRRRVRQVGLWAMGLQGHAWHAEFTPLGARRQGTTVLRGLGRIVGLLAVGLLPVGCSRGAKVLSCT